MECFKDTGTRLQDLWVTLNYHAIGETNGYVYSMTIVNVFMLVECDHGHHK